MPRPAKSLCPADGKAQTSASFCTDSTRPPLAVTAMPQSEKKSLASSSTFSGASISDSRVKLRSSAYRMAAWRRSAALCIARRRHAVEVVLPDVQVALARLHDRVFHPELLGETLD